MGCDGGGSGGPGGGGVMDCVIPAHDKDLETLPLTVASARRCLPEVRRVLVVGARGGVVEDAVRSGAAGQCEFVDEGSGVWPFRREDLDACGCPAGWLLQQLLKLYAPLVLPGITPAVLVCDSDVVWLEEGTRFLEDERRGADDAASDCAGDAAPTVFAAHICTFDTEACPPIRSAVDLHRYDDFVGAVLPGLRKRRPGKETAVCHHMCLQRAVLSDLDGQVRAAGGRPLWRAIVDAAGALGGRASEYELYHAFACAHWPSAARVWRPPFAVTADFRSASAKPPVNTVFLVSHSHLRGLSACELLDREGVLNAAAAPQALKALGLAGGLLLGGGRGPELAALLHGSGML